MVQIYLIIIVFLLKVQIVLVLMEHLVIYLDHQLHIIHKVIFQFLYGLI